MQETLEIPARALRPTEKDRRLAQLRAPVPTVPGENAISRQLHPTSQILSQRQPLTPVAQPLAKQHDGWQWHAGQR